MLIILQLFNKVVYLKDSTRMKFTRLKLSRIYRHQREDLFSIDNL